MIVGCANVVSSNLPATPKPPGTSTPEEAFAASVSLHSNSGSYDGYQVIHEMKQGWDRGDQESRQGGKLEVIGDVVLLLPIYGTGWDSFFCIH